MSLQGRITWKINVHALKQIAKDLEKTPTISIPLNDNLELLIKRKHYPSKEEWENFKNVV